MSLDPNLSSTIAQLFADARAGRSHLAPSQYDPGVGSSYRVASLDLSVVEALRQIDRESVPDLPDRVIVATALHLGLPPITRDSKLQACAVVTCVW